MPTIERAVVGTVKKVAADTDKRIEEAGDAEASASMLDSGAGTLFEEADAAAAEKPHNW